MHTHIGAYGNLSETSAKAQVVSLPPRPHIPSTRFSLQLDATGCYRDTRWFAPAMKFAENCSGDSCQTIRQSILKAGVLSVIQVPGIITFRCGILEASREYVDRKLGKVLRYRHSDSDAITKNIFINLNCAQLYFGT